jgi:hypothetical protein
MIGEFVLTENELLKKRPTPDSIGMGSYTMDSHNVQRYITPEGYVQNEGDIGVSTHGPYQIAYGSIVPKRGQCDNLLVPVCLSSSHIAFGSIRMEPVFMILGHSAATAAVIAIDGGTNVQGVAYAKLREQLLKDGQVLEATGFDIGGAYGQDPAKLAGTVIDDTKAVTTGQWTSSTASKTWVGQSYRHDGDQRDAKATARFETKLPESGTYEVRLGYTPNNNRASNVSVEVHHAGGQSTVIVNQKHQPPIDDLFVSLGKYEFHADKPSAVVVSNRNADGYVIIDAVQWVRVE